MANTDQYKQGYEFFQNKDNELLSSEQLKQMHPIFRRGYRTAQEDHMKKNNKSFPLVLSDIPQRGEVFHATWNDIMAATRRPRFNKLHNTPELAVMLNEIIKSVEQHIPEITRYKDVVRLVDEKFNIILQYGYDCGILNVKDLAKYNFVPVTDK